MKKKLLTIVVSILLVIMLTFSLSACNGFTGTIEIESCTAEEAFTSIAFNHYPEEPQNTWNFVYDKSWAPKTLDEGTPPTRFSSISQMNFDKEKWAGSEFGVLQFYIKTDKNVQTYFHIKYYANNSADNIDVITTEFYTFEQDVEQLITISFENNFIVAKSHEFATLSLSFETDAQAGGPSWQEWAKTKYTIRAFELGLNN